MNYTFIADIVNPETGKTYLEKVQNLKNLNLLYCLK